MLDQIATLFACLFIGEAFSRTGLIPFPGSVIGLIMMFLIIFCRGGFPRPMGELADNVLGLLGMLFVPAGVGVLAYQDLIRREMFPILGGVVGGTIIAVAATAIAGSALTAADRRRESLREAEVSDESA